MSAENFSICIIGTGDFGRALAKRMVTNGYDVIFGSRRPASRALGKIDKVLGAVRVMDIGQAIQESEIVVLAMHASHHSSIRNFSSQLSGKIVIDVSNPKEHSGSVLSQAESLAHMLPGASVVKAFNTLSAYVIGNGMEEQATVRVCADDYEARQVVAHLASRLGFNALDTGALQNAKRLEEVNLQCFPGWGLPSLVLLIVFSFWTVYGVVRYTQLKAHPYTWERLPSNIFNKVFACTAITMLALVYMPGCFAGFAQLVRGTKHKRFSKGLDNWLKMRKQLGLYALLFALMHTVTSLALLNPAYYGTWYLNSKHTVPLNRTTDTEINLDSRMSWRGETTLLLGLLATVAMCILGVTSLPSVSRLLNWKEWMSIQTYLGFVCLLLAVAHVMVKSLQGWSKQSFFYAVQNLTFLSLVVPWLVVVMKLILLLPCVDNRLWKIRQGWERGAKDAEAVPPPLPIKGVKPLPEDKTLGVKFPTNPAFGMSMLAGKLNLGYEDHTYDNANPATLATTSEIAMASEIASEAIANVHQVATNSEDNL